MTIDNLEHINPEDSRELQLGDLIVTPVRNPIDEMCVDGFKIQVVITSLDPDWILDKGVWGLIDNFGATIFRVRL